MGGQSFNCKFCEKWFLQKSSLINHMKDKHPEDFRKLKEKPVTGWEIRGLVNRGI